jgi:oxaloacetate decarboxylase alpha subunit
MASVKFVDTTLRDGNQCLWATRLSTPQMYPILDTLGRSGFHAIELMGLVHFDAPVRYLKENPWERIRLVHDKIKAVPLQSLMRSNCLLGFDPKPDDINQLWLERLVANGIQRIVSFDGLHDWSNIVNNLRYTKKLGATAGAWLTYSESPIHTDEFYVEKAKELITQVPDLDLITLEDASGILTVDRVRTLIPAIKGAIGDITLELHGHCLTGQAPLVYLEAARLGVEILYTSIPPLADGAAPPSVVQSVNNLRRLGFTHDLDLDAIEEIRDYLTRLAEVLNLEHGKPVEFDIFQHEHQIAGGVLSNLRSQLRDAGLSHRLNEVLEECIHVRRDLGWPIVVTPFAQLLVTQSVLNVVHGERYRIVPDEIKKYVLGYYGHPQSKIDEDILDRIIENGSDRISSVPPELLPAVSDLRKQYPDADDDERLLRYLFQGTQVDAMVEAGSIDVDSFSLDRYGSVVDILENLLRNTNLTHLEYSSGNMYFSFKR